MCITKKKKITKRQKSKKRKNGNFSTSKEVLQKRKKKYGHKKNNVNFLPPIPFGQPDIQRHIFDPPI